MILFKTIDIADNERGLLYNRNRLQDVLVPGRYRLPTLGNKYRVETYDITEVAFEHPKLKFLVREYGQLLSHFIDTFETDNHQVGLLYRDKVLSEVIPPKSFRVTWKGSEVVDVNVIDISQRFEVQNELLAILPRSDRLKTSPVNVITVPDNYVGLLVVDGKLDRLLATGQHGFWQYNRCIALQLVDLRVQTVDISGQEILTKDRVSLRVNLSASYRITDPKRAVLAVKDYANALYLELQLRLREAVGTQSLDQLLADKNALNVTIADSARESAIALGIELRSVGVKDIILPGDMKAILNQVVEAQKEAEANLIKRREETQAMRSLHNTAKVMENSPVLLRLKELETLERITAKIDNLTVYGGLDSVLNETIKLAPNKAN